MANVEVTVVLEEEQVNALIAVADKEGITLSALFRDIVASYVGEHAAVERACLWALHRCFQGDKEESEQYNSGRSHEVQMLRDEIVALREWITDHLANHEAGGRSLKPQSHQIVPPSLFEDVDESGASPPVTIDSTVLVKETKPVAPVIEAPGYGSFQEIDDGKEYSVAEVSAYLGLSSATVRKYARDGKISARKMKREYVFLGKDIRDYLLTSS
jgi:excisionase family DNA binding protein